MASTIAVTGSTGAVGGAVATLLADTGTPLRLLVRDVGRAPAILERAVAQSPLQRRGCVDADLPKLVARLDCVADAPGSTNQTPISLTLSGTKYIMAPNREFVEACSIGWGPTQTCFIGGQKV